MHLGECALGRLGIKCSTNVNVVELIHGDIQGHYFLTIFCVNVLPNAVNGALKVPYPSCVTVGFSLCVR